MQTKLQGYKITKNNLDIIVSELIKMTPSERSQLSSLSERRSEIIVPGALILQTIMTMTNVNEIILSERALREGLVVDWMCRNNYLKDQLSFQGQLEKEQLFIKRKDLVLIQNDQKVYQNLPLLFMIRPKVFCIMIMVKVEIFCGQQLSFTHVVNILI